MAKASDFSKRLKAKHLGGKPRELTIGQVGVEKMQRRNKPDVTIFAVEGMEAATDVKTENVVYLWFRELGVTRNMRLNETNLDVLITARGDDFKGWLNCKVTLTPEEIFAFGKKQDTIVISKVTAPATKPNVNKETGEIVGVETNSQKPEKKDNATVFWARARALEKQPEASAILEKHSVTDITGKTTDWVAAIAELETLAEPVAA
jgi:hypothetical protein